MERRLSSQITLGSQIRIGKTPRNPGNEVWMITRLRNQIPRVRAEFRALNSPTLLKISRPYGIETSRRGDTAAFFVETRVPATTSADVSRRLCLTRSRARLPPSADGLPFEPQSLELSVARRVSG